MAIVQFFGSLAMLSFGVMLFFIFLSIFHGQDGRSIAYSVYVFASLITLKLFTVITIICYILEKLNGKS